MAVRVCDGSQLAASRVLRRPVAVRIASRAPADLQCVLTATDLRVSILSQASSRAYTEFDTEESHQDQVYGAGVHQTAQIPQEISVPGSAVAVWIRAQKLLVATNATPTTGGSYVTVTMTATSTPPAAVLAVARAVARAIFAAQPNGSS